MTATSLIRSAAFRAVLLCGALSACGGGGGGGDASTPPVSADLPPVESPAPAPVPVRSAYLLHSIKVKVCRIDSSNSLSDCIDAGASGYSGMTAMAIAGSHAYIAEISGWIPPRIIHCDIGADGTFSGCATTGPAGLLNPYGLTVHGSTLYIGESGSSFPIYKCDITSEGALDACADTGFPASLPNEADDIQIVGTTMYVLHYFSNRLSKCDLEADGRISSDSCVDTGIEGLDWPESIAISGSHMYIANINADGGPGNVIHCTLAADGSPGDCIDAGAEGLNRPTQVVIRGSTVYISDLDSVNGVTRCTAQSDGRLTDCSALFADSKILYGIVLR